MPAALPQAPKDRSVSVAARIGDVGSEAAGGDISREWRTSGPFTPVGVSNGLEGSLETVVRAERCNYLRGLDVGDRIVR